MTVNRQRVHTDNSPTGAAAAAGFGHFDGVEGGGEFLLGEDSFSCPKFRAALGQRRDEGEGTG